MILLPTMAALIPKLMIDFVETRAPVSQFVRMIVTVSMLVALISWLRPALQEKMSAFGQNVSMRFSILAFEKLLNMDYANLECYENRLKFERCQSFAFGGRWSAGSRSVWHVTALCVSLLGVATYFVLLGRVKLWLMLILVGACALEFLIYQAIVKLNMKVRKQCMEKQLRFRYFFSSGHRSQSGQGRPSFGRKGLAAAAFGEGDGGIHKNSALLLGPAFSDDFSSGAVLFCA
jgi:hypothetical protein